MIAAPYPRSRRRPGLSRGRTAKGFARQPIWLEFTAFCKPVRLWDSMPFTKPWGNRKPFARRAPDANSIISNSSIPTAIATKILRRIGLLYEIENSLCEQFGKPKHFPCWSPSRYGCVRACWLCRLNPRRPKSSVARSTSSKYCCCAATTASPTSITM